MPPSPKLKELVGLEPGKPDFRDYQENELKETEIRAEVQHGSMKHGTDLQLLSGITPIQHQRFDQEYALFLPDETPSRIYPFPLGNMWVGRISAVGKSIKGYAVGERVAGYGPLRPTQTFDPAQNWVAKLSDRMTWQEAVCYDPTLYAYSGVRDGNVRIGDAVAVFGLGAIGLMAVQLARLSGATTIIAVHPILNRRKVALACGADHIIDPIREDAGLEIKKITDKRGVDVAIETSGSYPALQAAIRGCSFGGTVSVVGWYKECTGGLILGREAHINRVNLIVSRACSDPDRDHPRWDFKRVCDSTWQLLSHGKLKCDLVVTPVVPFAESGAAIVQIVKKPDESIKLGVQF